MDKGYSGGGALKRPITKSIQFKKDGTFANTVNIPCNVVSPTINSILPLKHLEIKLEGEL